MGILKIKELKTLVILNILHQRYPNFYCFAWVFTLKQPSKLCSTMWVKASINAKCCHYELYPIAPSEFPYNMTYDANVNQFIIH